VKVPDVLADARQLIQSRLAELEAEAKSLERALASLGEGVGAKRRPGRPRKRAVVDAALPQRKRARRKGKGKRAPRGQRREQFLAAVKAKPGARVSELAKELGISPNQAYTLAGRLQKDGAIRKSGKGYRAVAKPKP
jgi:hypothetical protein